MQRAAQRGGPHCIPLRCAAPTSRVDTDSITNFVNRRSILRSQNADGPPSGAARNQQCDDSVQRIAYFIFPLTAILSCFPARNAGAMDALI